MKEATMLRSEVTGLKPRAPPWGEQERKESEVSKLLLGARERKGTFNEMLQHAFDEMLQHEADVRSVSGVRGVTNGIDVEATVSQPASVPTDLAPIVATAQAAPR
jgi:hypothetical protein